ncbi:MAG: fibronectin type III domain-containing protein [Proteobacteria bacterium]|nr:fibronectin type III domain-containing protein [Pseudomonadota bacterium]MBU1389750.1 fibronectin type III domain-containing protein [Pseudomonadota bacterium]MBU1543759.1 fibronectin type III domain-containing protein [Pseudomonadota bacterium]MBU2429787.1 fibronectin type III domain-containing protein [Pseudomonadota bacterium]
MVESTPSVVIEGYKVYYKTAQGSAVLAARLGNVTSYDLDSLPLVPTQTYYFAVSAYSTAGMEGPLSAWVPYTESPGIVNFPVISSDRKSIDVTYNESNMQGADVKANYSFSPSIPFDAGYEILRIDKTYRLYLSYIPEYTIFILTVSNVTDSAGHGLISGTVMINDNDVDGLPDDWETHYGVTVPGSDSDADGLLNYSEFLAGTNPTNADTDHDGLPDGWEINNGLDPLNNDAAGDIDCDGISNLDEYTQGSSVANSSPAKPVLVSPANASSDVGLRSRFTTRAYRDPENDIHVKTQWQVSADQNFVNTQDMLLNLESFECLTSLDMPAFILETGRRYYWRVRFADSMSSYSAWSEPFSFSTPAADPEDYDNNGVPDIQQFVEAGIDLNNDGEADVFSDTYKMVTDGSVVLSIEASSNVLAIDRLETIPPGDILDSFGKPEDLNIGLIQFRLRINNPGNSARIKIYFSEPVGEHWYKYDLINGWREYSDDYPGNVVFGADKKSVLLTFVDGGAGDSDGVANGIIVDPSGPGGIISSISTASSAASGGGGGGGGGGCFIATAAFGSPVEKHVQVLKDFRDVFLLKSRMGQAFVAAYYKYSPPIADMIARQDGLRAVVRFALMPLIALGYVVVYLSAVQQAILVLSVLSLFILTGWRIKKYF